MVGNQRHWAVALAMAVGLTTGLTPPAGATPPTCSNLQAARPLSNPVLKTIAEGMPHKCDDQIWGRWLCGERYYAGDPHRPIGVGMTITLTSDVTPERFERIRFQVEPKGFASRTDVFYPVDRQWHPDPMDESKMKMVSCNAVTDSGEKTMTFYHKKADGSKEGRGWMSFFMTSDPNLMKLEFYKYRPKPGNVDQGDLLDSDLCERLSY